MLRKVVSRWGECTYFAKDEYVGKSIHNYGEYNPDETEFIIAHAIPGKLCLDIGANIGVMSMALAASGFDVVAFEPQPEVAKVCAMNFKGRVEACALGATAGIGKMPKIRYSEKNNVGGMGIGYQSIFGSIDVPIKTLDSYEFENVGFIKIDVEGFEEQVLMGGRETILRDRPIMYIEDDRQDKSASLHKYIEFLGYKWEIHRPPLYRENNFFGKSTNVWGKNYVSHNILCQPI